VLILSDFLQTGQESRSFYRKVAEHVQGRGVDRIIGIGPELMASAARFPMAKSFYLTTEDFLQSDEIRSLSRSLVLVKGSRSFGFDRIAEQLTLKVHETTLAIDLGAMIDNLNHYRSLMKPSTKIVCMVKAFAYGAGFYEIAKTLQDHRVDYLAVAVADEGEQLRKAGITASILVMNPELTAFKALFENNLEPEIYSFTLLDEMIRLGKKLNYMTVPAAIRELEKIEMLKGADNEYNLDYAVTATQKTILNAFGMSADNIHRQARGISTDLARIEAETFEKQTGGHAEGSV
jgi:alanine racemase